jgi:cobalt-zinc-cadmium efflux system membrane fusion protein
MMTLQLLRRIALHLGTLALAWPLAACSPAAKPQEVTSAPSAPLIDPMLVRVAEGQAAQFPTQTVLARAVADTQTHPGRIEANEQRVSRVGSAVVGRISAVNVELGDAIQPGQTLARLTSAELTSAQLAYLRANSNLTQAERAVERARQMIQADVISSAELQKRESELAIARAESRAAQDQLALLGLPAESIERLRQEGRLQPEAVVSARQGGVLLERKVNAGQVVQPGDSLFTVADLSSVWAVGSLPEQTASLIRKGQPVEVDIPALDRTLRGKVVFVGDTIQPETRTVAIRTQLDNPNRDLKPQMLVTLRIELGGRQLAVVPEAAVVRENDIDHVFVQVEPGVFRLTQVQLDPAIGKLRPVRSGVEVGAVIVGEGAFHLNNLRNQQSLTTGGTQ